MLFLVLGVIVGSLLTFGAVLPAASYTIAILLMLLVCGYFMWHTLRDGNWNVSSAVLLVLAFLVLAAQTRFGISATLGALAFLSVRKEQGRAARLLKWLALIGTVEAMLGLVQQFLSPGWIFGYINPFYRVSGTLINRNHFAGLLELLIPTTFGLAYIYAQRFGGVARSYVYLFAGAFMGLALMLTSSRSGIFSFFMTVFLITALLYLRTSQQQFAMIFLLTVAGLVAAGAVWIGIDVVIQRYAELFQEEAMLRDGRMLVFRDTIKMIIDHPLGVGAGNFQDRFREYQTFRPNLLFDHAHNDYLETAAEWGVPIAVLFWSFIGFCFVRAVRLFFSINSLEKEGALLACIGAVFSILVHSLTDFNLQIPSNAMVFFVFVGTSLALGMSETNGRREQVG